MGSLASRGHCTDNNYLIYVCYYGFNLYITVYLHYTNINY